MSEPSTVELSDDRARAIFLNEIVPEQLASGASQSDPIAVFVAGQPGAGKTATTKSIKDRLDTRGGSIIADADRYKPYHPQYAVLQHEDDQRAAALVSPDSGRWMRMAQDWLAEHRVDTLTETTMRDERYFAVPAATFRQAGYRIETAIMAVPEAQSRLGILDRYEFQVRTTGHGRLTLRDNHDSAYAGVLDTAAAIERDRLADEVSVYRRGNERLYHNEIGEDGTWREPGGLREAIERERSRPWTEPESRQFADTYHRLAGRLGPELHDELDGIARAAEPLLHHDVELTAAGGRTPSRPELSTSLTSLDRAEAALDDALGAPSPPEDVPARDAAHEDVQPSR